jgi:prepilin-type N-terminal cleavage/methylation domain-containing protein
MEQVTERPQPAQSSIHKSTLHARHRVAWQGRCGFALNEMMLALAVVSLVIAISAGAYSLLKRRVSADDQAIKLAALGEDIRRHWRGTGSFTGLSAPALFKLGLVQRPMTADAASMYDAWLAPMQFSGADTRFAIVLGGNGVMTRDECSAVASGIESTAYEVRVGAGVAPGSGATLGRLTGGYAFKSNGNSYDQAALASGCAEAGTKIGVSFDG